MPFQLSAPQATVVALDAEIDLTNREGVYDRLYAAFASGADIVVADFTGTRFCDTGSLRRLITVQQRASAGGGQLWLLIPSGSPVRRLADLLRLDRELVIYPDGRAIASDTAA